MKAFDKAVELVIETPFRLNSLTEERSKLIDHLPRFTGVAVRIAKFVFVK